jgi:hypothetical protein
VLQVSANGPAPGACDSSSPPPQPANMANAAAPIQPKRKLKRIVDLPGD